MACLPEWWGGPVGLRVGPAQDVGYIQSILNKQQVLNKYTAAVVIS